MARHGAGWCWAEPEPPERGRGCEKGQKGKGKSKGKGKGRGKGKGGELNETSREWPMTVAQYPPQGSPGSWQEMPGLAEELDCVLKLGGQRTATRHSRHATWMAIKSTSSLD
eukprot:4863941-Lingulodinium_polyedra.AAC.1